MSLRKRLSFKRVWNFNTVSSTYMYTNYTHTHAVEAFLRSVTIGVCISLREDKKQEWLMGSAKCSIKSNTRDLSVCFPNT